jgi:hypothetical protein
VVTDGRNDKTDLPAGDSVADEHDSPNCPGPATGPLLLWLLVQLAALLLASLRIALAAKYPQPAEALATHMMLAAQVAAASLLFPYLMRDWTTATAVIATAWPFAATASVLSAVPLAATAAGEAYVTVWLVTLALWSAALRTPRSKLYGLAVAAILSIGGAALWYLAREFNPGADVAVGGSGDRLLAASPLVAALRNLSPQRPRWTENLIPTALAAAALFLLLAQRRRSRARLSTARARGAQTTGPITS